MKHLRIFEEFKDDLPSIARDMFDLTHTFEIKYSAPREPWGSIKEIVYAEIKGPLENFDQAKEIADELQDGVERAEDNFASDGAYVDDGDIDEFVEKYDFVNRFAKLGYYFYYDGVKFSPTNDNKKDDI